MPPSPEPSRPGPGHRLVAAVAARDPGFWGIKRSVRAAVVIPVVFALARVVGGSGASGIFAAFSAFALLLFVEFHGSFRSRLRSYLALTAVGMVLFTLGTLCTAADWLAVGGMAVVAFVVLFVGIGSPALAASATAALLMFVLPVSVPAPPDQIPARLAGLAVAAVLCIPAALWWWPRPWRDALRAQTARAARALAGLLGARAEGSTEAEAHGAAVRELGALGTTFQASLYPPTGAAGDDLTLARTITRLQWVGRAVTAQPPGAPQAPLPESPPLARAMAAVLGALADLVVAVPSGGRGEHEARAATIGALDALQRQRIAAVRTSLDRVLAEPGPGVAALERAAGQDAAQLLRAIDPGFAARAEAYSTEMLGVAGLGANEGLAPTREDRSLSSQLQLGGEGAGGRAGAFGRLAAAWREAVPRIHAHLSLRSVWMRNALRGAAGLALAVAIVRTTSVEHGFWVVLGTVSVLRSNALGTGATVLRALLGTLVGFVVGTLIIVPVGGHAAALWAILPLAVLLAGIAPALISFTAGQAGFTVTVIVLFNIIQPVGWRVGLIRIEDVAIGGAVSVVVGLLFWPRGATAALARALSDSYEECSGYFAHAVAAITRRPEAPVLEAARGRAVESYHRLDDSVRQYLAERGAKTVPMATVVGLVGGATQLRLSAESLVLLPTLPGGSDGDPGGGSAPGAGPMTAAAAALDEACAGAHRWYAALGRALSHHGAAPAPEELHTELHRPLLGAYEAARRAGAADGVRTALRLLWADQDLEEQLALQPALAELAGTFARRSGRLV